MFFMLLLCDVGIWGYVLGSFMDLNSMVVCLDERLG